jgi:hypothetical protein
MLVQWRGKEIVPSWNRQRVLSTESEREIPAPAIRQNFRPRHSRRRDHRPDHPGPLLRPRPERPGDRCDRANKSGDVTIDAEDQASDRKLKSNCKGC